MCIGIRLKGITKFHEERKAPFFSTIYIQFLPLSLCLMKSTVFISDRAGNRAPSFIEWNTAGLTACIITLSFNHFFFFLKNIWGGSELSCGFSKLRNWIS